ncbi:TonB-dependent receptor domain-containing protein [Chryseobacterium sp. T1]
MKRTSVLLLSLFGMLTWAQSIEGKITDQHKQSISYAEVVLTQKDKKITAITTENGNYELKLPANGSYLLEIYRDDQKIYSEQVDIQGTITKDILTEIKTAEKQLEGVTVVAQKKKLVERKVDRLVFNVENSVAAQGLDAMEALAKTPMLRTTDDAISIAGKNQVAVMVNDRLLNISGQELINYLKSLRSDDIAKIEVITTPPSKYAADGISGLINIILKKNTSLGFNGSLQMSANYNKHIASWRDGTTLNYQGKKLSLTANLGIGENQFRQENFNNIVGNDFYWKNTNLYFGRYRYKNSNIKAEYKLNDKNTIGASYNYSFSNPLNQNDGNTRTENAGKYSEFISKNTTLNNNKNHYATAFYDVKLDSLGSKLSLSANLMANNTNANNRIFTTTDRLKESLNLPENKYRIYSAQADLEKNFNKIKTEAGFKFSSINNNSSVKFFDIENDNYIINPKKTYDFIYDERNYAAYISTNFKISEKWDAKAGLRYEYTELTGESPQTNLTNSTQYGKFFPTAYISYKPNDNNAYSINYSRRIRRPYFGNLNPFRNYTSDFEYFVGNPYLQPSFTDNLELSYVLKNNFTTTLYYNDSKNSYDGIMKIIDGTRLRTIENFFSEIQTGLSVNYNFNKLKWLESNIFATGFYNKSKTDRSDIVVNSGSYGANLNIDNNFFLTKDKTVILYLGYWADFPSQKGISNISMMNGTYGGVKLNLMQKNLMLQFHVNDIFNTQYYKGEEYYSNYTSNFKYKGSSQNVYLSATYKFGNNNVKGATKQNKFEEQSRVGGGS